MMIATIILLVSLAFFFFKDKLLFSFWNFLWIYPLELIIYLIVWIIVVIIMLWCEE